MKKIIFILALVVTVSCVSHNSNASNEEVDTMEVNDSMMNDTVNFPDTLINAETVM